jgi:hypothetical protein
MSRLVAWGHRGNDPEEALERLVGIESGDDAPDGAAER